MTNTPKRKNRLVINRALNIVLFENIFFAILVGYTLYIWTMPALFCGIAVLVAYVILTILEKEKFGFFFATGLFSLFWAYCVGVSWFKSAPIIGGLLFFGSFAGFLFCHKQYYDEREEEE